MNYKLYILISLILFYFTIGCSPSNKKNAIDSASIDTAVNSKSFANSSLILEGTTVKTRYKVPEYFERVNTTPGSFENFLQNLPLKPLDTPPHLFNGALKKDSAHLYSSVIDLDIDNVDLQHSYQSIIRLWAEYLFQTKQYGKLSFIIQDEIPFDFNRWLQGYRIESKGKKLKIKKMVNEKKLNYETFREYLCDVFEYTDANSFRKNLRMIKDEKENNEFGIGTIIMSGVAPYEAVMVVDMIEMNDNHPFGPPKQKGVLLSYGDSPAQEIEIMRGNIDFLGIFPHNRGETWKNDAGSIWVTTSKGERAIDEQGGNLDLVLYDIRLIDKLLLKFNT